MYSDSLWISVCWKEVFKNSTPLTAPKSKTHPSFGFRLQSGSPFFPIAPTFWSRSHYEHWGRPSTRLPRLLSPSRIKWDAFTSNRKTAYSDWSFNPQIQDRHPLGSNESPCPSADDSWISPSKTSARAHSGVQEFPCFGKIYFVGSLFRWWKLQYVQTMPALPLPIVLDVYFHGKRKHVPRTLSQLPQPISVFRPLLPHPSSRH